MFKRKRGNQEAAARQQAPRAEMPVSIHHVLQVRKAWLGGMFLLGVVTQYLLAIYAPEVWNYIYTVLKNFVT